MADIKIVPLGAGQDVGRSCILVIINGFNIMLDCGMHMGYQDDRRFPDFSYINGGSKLTDFLDCVIISHFHLDHCGSLPHMSEVVGYEGPIYMTYPTKAIAPVLLEDYRKVQTDIKGDTNFFTSTHIKNCIRKVVAVNLHEVIQVKEDLEIRAFYAGHVLGAAMFEVRSGGQSILYTGDFNMTPDRHLGAARVIPGLRPDLLISESTYATTIRDSKRARERDFLKKVHDTVMNGGKVLIPVFALGRAQELCILLESYWERLDLKIPMYFSQGLAGKANKYYRLFINWTNEKIKKTFVKHNMFDLKHIEPLPDSAYADMPGPMVLLSTPGMLHGGHSLQVFKKWCGDPKNAIIMPGYCVAGTVGAKVIGGSKQIEMDGRMYNINLSVEYMSFSAHADAKGIMQLIRDVEPRNVMFVHGEAGKMEFLKEKVEQEFRIPVYKPANGETVSIEPFCGMELDVPCDLIQESIILDPTPVKRFCPFRATMMVDKLSLEVHVVSCETAAKQLAIPEHQLMFSEIMSGHRYIDWQELALILREKDPGLQLKADGIELFDGELCVLVVKNEPSQAELIWNEKLETWQPVITGIVQDYLNSDAKEGPDGSRRAQLDTGEIREEGITSEEEEDSDPGTSSAMDTSPTKGGQKANDDGDKETENINLDEVIARGWWISESGEVREAEPFVDFDPDTEEKPVMTKEIYEERQRMREEYERRETERNENRRKGEKISAAGDTLEELRWKMRMVKKLANPVVRTLPKEEEKNEQVEEEEDEEEEEPKQKATKVPDVVTID